MPFAFVNTRSASFPVRSSGLFQGDSLTLHAYFQGEINTLERTRSSMAEEIVRLTNVNEELEETATEVEELRSQLKVNVGFHDPPDDRP